MILLPLFSALLIALLLALFAGFARGDRAAVEAGALDYLNTIAVKLRRC